MKTERARAIEIIQGLGAGLKTIVELGAHHGNDTIELYAAGCSGAGCRYIAVEADPRNVPVLARRLLGCDVNVVHAAVWRACGEITLHLCEGNANGSSSAREPREHLKHFPAIPFNGTALVPALTLDAIADAYRLQHVDLIWSDIQGAERDMIAGGAHTLARTEWLLTECDRCEMYAGQATRDELLQLLPTWELVAEWPENANLLLRNRSAQ